MTTTPAPQIEQVRCRSALDETRSAPAESLWNGNLSHHQSVGG